MNYASNRNALFGSRTSNNIASNAAHNSNAKTAHRRDVNEQTQSIFEEENNRALEMLGDRVSLLKGVAKDIGIEVRDQNNMLDGMSNDYEGAGGLLGATVDKLGKMLATGGSKHMCYIILFVMFVFFLLYYVIKK